jgi:3-oxoacyl-[acyl-carrier protein] reductase
LNLKGQVAIVTGGGRGLGKAAAARMARAGANVVIAEFGDFGRDAAEEVSQIGPKSIFVQTDVSDSESVAAMVATAVETFGRIDILVNNAAIYPFHTWEETSEEEWDRVFAVNMKGCFLCAKAVIPHMQAQGRGKIINIASITFFFGPEGLLHYVATKGGVIGFTRSLARELGPHNINVNAVSPGAIPTHTEADMDPEERRRIVLASQSIKRRGTPEDIANLVCFLASDESDFITGQSIGVDGGWIMH